MARLPQPGGDDGNWGEILNEYLSQSHASDGSLGSNSVGATQLRDDSITAAKLQTNSVTSDAVAPNAVTKADIGLANVDNTSDLTKPISNSQQAALDEKASLSSLTAKLNTNDLDAAVATAISNGSSLTRNALSASFARVEDGALIGPDGEPIATGAVSESQYLDLLTRLEAVEGGIIPEGGAPTQVLAKTSSFDREVAWVDPVDAVVGIRPWESSALLYATSFADGLVPSWITYVRQAGTTPYNPVVIATSAALGGNKPAYSNALVCAASNSGTSAVYGETTFNISSAPSVSGNTVTRVKYYMSLQRPGAASSIDGITTVGSVVRRNDTTPSAGTGTDFIVVDFDITGDPTIKLRLNKGTGTGNAQNGYVVTGFEIYGTAAPYMFNDIVMYQGLTYRSMQDNNPYTPGGPQGWQQI